MAELRLNRRRLLGSAMASMALAACDRVGVGTGAAKPSFNGIDITGAEYARQLTLTDADGQPRTLADFKGKVPVVFFGDRKSTRLNSSHG